MFILAHGTTLVNLESIKQIDIENRSRTDGSKAVSLIAHILDGSQLVLGDYKTIKEAEYAFVKIETQLSRAKYLIDD